MSTTSSGIAAVGNVPWGTHFCQFYENGGDLAESLVPFFKAGLDNNERCLWVTSEPFGSEDARAALRNAVPDLDRREGKGQIEIVDFQNWYLRTGNLSPDETVNDWLARAQGAVDSGHRGLRLTGNTFWLECEAFDEFADYEATVNRRFTSQPIVALCSYCLGRCRPTDVLAVVRNHQFAVTRWRGEWEVVEDASLKIARTELLRINSHLDEMVRDRTARLEQALGEKTELFNEVHHRVRNNLQVLGSLVRMKLRQAAAPDVRQTFLDVIGRMDAIALVHNTLYDSGESSRVPFAQYLEKLCDGILQLGYGGERVRLHISSGDTPVPLAQAVPLGLIVNELVTNALKHAFPDDRQGDVRVSFRCDNAGCELTVADNGIGLTEPALRTRSGLRVVEGLATQLDATLSSWSEGGATFRLRFPKEVLDDSGPLPPHLH